MTFFVPPEPSQIEAPTLAFSVKWLNRDWQCD
jgi:hypothetical protein